MNVQRKLTIRERDVLTALLNAAAETSHYANELDDLFVAEMPDGGMGSLSLIPRAVTTEQRMFGMRIAEGEFTDDDGTLVSIAVNVDKSNQLFELDIWKVDFSKLIRLPDPSKIKITWTGFPEDRPHYRRS